MFDLTPVAPALVAFLVFVSVAAGLAVVTLAKLAVDTRKPRSRPVVLITPDRVPVSSAA